MPLYFTFVKDSKDHRTPFAIIDYVSCASVVSKVTLDHAIQTPKNDELQKKTICQQQHQFKTSYKLQNKICAARIHFECTSSESTQLVRFNIRFDVIGGSPPFQIGL